MQLHVRLLRAQLRSADAGHDHDALKKELSARKAELQALLENRQLQLQAKVLREAAAQRKSARRARLAAQIGAAKRTQALLREAVREENATLQQQQEQAHLAAQLEALEAHSAALDQPLAMGPADWSGTAPGWGPEQSAQQVFFEVDPKTGEVQPVAVPPADVRLQVFGTPFARGAHRSAHWALVDGAPNVAKRYLGGQSKKGSSPEETQTLEEDLAAHVKARFLADAFNEAASKRPVLTVPKLQYHQPSVCILAPAADGTGAAIKTVLLLEPFIPGSFVKWHLNDGTVLQEEETLQAFSHFSHTYSELGWQCMVADVQGVEASDGSFLLSDPALLTAAGGGLTDMGAPAIEKFLQAHHTCRELCQALEC